MVWVMCTFNFPIKVMSRQKLLIYPGTFKFNDEGSSAADGNLIQYITNSSSEDQYEHFVVHYLTD